MKRRLQGLDRIAYPLFAVSKIIGLYPVRNNKFSKCLYLYAWILGTSTSIYRILFVHNVWIPRDPIFNISIVISQTSLFVGWLLYLLYVPKFRNIEKTVEILRKNAGDAEIKLPWMPYAFMAMKFGFMVLMMIRRNTWLGILNYATYFIAKAPQELLPLQFAFIADVTAQLVAKNHRQLDFLHKDQEASVLLRHHEICQLFREINHFYSPFLVLTIASIFAFIPPISVVTLKLQMAITRKVFFLTEVSAPFIVLLILLKSSNTLKSKVSQFNGKLHEETRQHESLLQNLIATCITYDIILVQFIKPSSLNSTLNK